MAKVKTIDKTKHLIYNDGQVIYISPLMAINKFIKLVQDNYLQGHISQNWVRDRVSKGANDECLKLISENSNKFIICDRSNKIIKLIDIK